MLCQNCGKNEAVTHIKQIINGEMDEAHLCRDCARHLGYDDIFSGFDFDFGGFFRLASRRYDGSPSCG